MGADADIFHSAVSSLVSTPLRRYGRFFLLGDPGETKTRRHRVYILKHIYRYEFVC
ncbi:hypothetical protein Vpro01_00409 [Vibrio proteolyticus]